MTALPGVRNGRLADTSILRQGPLAEALNVLNGDGEETRLVGGAVRDLALGVKAQDLDLATTALPEETMRRAERARFKAIPTGLEHGTVTLIVRGRPIETTTLREDIETDGRRARVIFGRDFDEDSRRRDFTINALSLSQDGVVHDAVGGLADLAAGRVRFIGDPDARIREDYLRILRFFRFSARFCRGPLDREGFIAALQNRAGMELLSRERVRAELLKLIVAPRAGQVVRAMGEAGFLEPILGGLGYPGRFARLVAIEKARGGEGDATLRLGALSVAKVEDAGRLRERLRLTNAEHKRLEAAASTLERLHGLEEPPAHDALRALLFRAGRQTARDALTLVQAEAAEADDAAFRAADDLLTRARRPRPPFSGKDVLARGVPPGRQVGAILKAFEMAWIAAGFSEDAAQLDRLLHEAILVAAREGSDATAWGGAEPATGSINKSSPENT